MTLVRPLTAPSRRCYERDVGYRVNLGCVEGLDPLALEIGIIDGRSL